MTRPFIPYSCQAIDEEDIAAVAGILRSDFITQGPTIAAFEKTITDYCSAGHGVAVASATAGLHLACLALGVGKGDHVWTSSLSFVASANCALYCGASVDFVDIEPTTGNMCMQALAEKLAAADKTGTLPKVVIPVHYAGRACNMEALAALKKRYGFAVIEDAAHALGASYTDGKRIGKHSASEMIVFSFHAVKPITTGEGGMVMTERVDLAKTLYTLRTHGITRDTASLEHHDQPSWYYEMQTLGFHYRMTDMQAALGISQMKKLDRFIARRRALSERYDTLLAALPALKRPALCSRSAWHIYVVQVEASQRDTIFNALRAKHIGVNVHYWPIHLQPHYKSLGFKPGYLPNTETFAQTCLTLPLHQKLTDEEQEFVVRCLRELT